MHYSGVCETDE